MRYGAYTLDGTLIYEADAAQQIGDAVCMHIKRNQKPHIAYTFDNIPGTVWPYTTWKAEWSNYVGTPHKTFDEVVKELRK